MCHRRYMSMFVIQRLKQELFLFLQLENWFERPCRLGAYWQTAITRRDVEYACGSALEDLNGAEWECFIFICWTNRSWFLFPKYSGLKSNLPMTFRYLRCPALCQIALNAYVKVKTETLRLAMGFIFKVDTTCECLKRVVCLAVA